MLTSTDAHGEPGLSSDHGVCTAPQGMADAYDWNFCWKVWDALRSCAYSGRGTAGTRSATRAGTASTGRWSDGVPITPLKIQDAAPIEP